MNSITNSWNLVSMHVLLLPKTEIYSVKVKASWVKIEEINDIFYTYIKMLKATDQM